MFQSLLIAALVDKIRVEFNPNTVEDTDLRVSQLTGERYAPIFFRSEEFFCTFGLWDVTVRVGESGFVVKVYRPEYRESTTEEVRFASSSDVGAVVDQIHSVLEGVRKNLRYRDWCGLIASTGRAF